MLKGFRAARPAVEHRLGKQHSEALLGCELDAAFMWPLLHSAEVLALAPLAREPVIVAFAPGRLFAGHDVLTIAELAGEAIVVCPRRVRLGVSDAILAGCRPAGFARRIAKGATAAVGHGQLGDTGMDVAVVPACMRHQQLHSVHFMPLAGSDLRAPHGLVAPVRDGDGPPTS